MNQSFGNIPSREEWLAEQQKKQPAAQQAPARTALLEEAMRITAVDRNKQYGNPEDNFQNIANFWNAYLTQVPGQGNIIPLTSQDITHLMILMKMARLNTNPSHRDSLVDIAGYAACGEDCRVKRISEVNKVGGAIAGGSGMHSGDSLAAYQQRGEGHI